MRFLVAGALLLGAMLHMRPASAQTGPPLDTLAVSLADVEARFLTSNLSLLAARFGVSQAEAQVEQARLFANPTATVEVNAFNPGINKLFPKKQAGDGQFPYGGGEYTWAVTQLVNLAGQRAKLVAVQRAGVAIAKRQLADVLRSLRYALRTTYVGLYFDGQRLALLQQELARLSDINRINRIELARGVVSPYDVTRLEAERISLSADIAGTQQQIASGQATIKLLLADSTTRYIRPADVQDQSSTPSPLKALIDSALARRPDLMAARESQRQAGLNVELQRALAVPQLQLGVDYDRYGNAYANYYGANASIPLPFFNRNQGNIKLAKAQTQVAGSAVALTEIQVRTEVQTAYAAYQASLQRLSALPPDYQRSIANIGTEADGAYQRRAIGLLEYLDKFRTFKNARLQLLDLRENLYDQYQGLQLATAAGN